MGNSNARLSSLDGLRGIAAVVVLLHHSLLTVPVLASAYYPGAAVPDGWARLLTYSPLHIVWAGTEAVYVFFLLSGFVLALSASRGPQDWGRYFPARLVRLYLPVFGAVAFGALTILLVPRTGHHDSLWVRARPAGYDLASIVRDLTLLEGNSRTLSQLWSLQFEVLFSLLLPAYLFVAARIRAVWLLLACFALLALGTVADSGSLLYLPMFGLGVALARAWPALVESAERINRHRWQWAFWAAVGVASALLVTSFWTGGPRGDSALPVTRVLILLGAIGFLLLAGLSPAARAVLSFRPIRFLGTISFSLYLVHEPLVIAFAYVFPTSPRKGALVAIVVSLVVAYVFYRLIEKPVQRLARSIGRSGPVVRVDDPESLVSAPSLATPPAR